MKSLLMKRVTTPLYQDLWLTLPAYKSFSKMPQCGAGSGTEFDGVKIPPRLNLITSIPGIPEFSNDEPSRSAILNGD